VIHRPRLSAKVCAAAGGLALMGAAPSCERDISARKGSPELRRLLVGPPDPEAPSVDLLGDAPDGGFFTHSPLSRLIAVFDRPLDGGKIEPGDAPGFGPALSITWMAAPPGAPAVRTMLAYSPGGTLDTTPPGPAVLIRPEPALPSGAMVVITFDKERITGKEGEILVGKEIHRLQTDPFTATIAVPKQGTDVPRTFAIRIAFNTVPGPARGHVRVTRDGLDIPIPPPAVDATARTVVVVSPPGGLWAEGATYKVLVGKDMPDHFGVKLGQEVMATFTTVGLTFDGGIDAAAAMDGEGEGPTAPDGGAVD